jgi:hypothetical protein
MKIQRVGLSGGFVDARRVEGRIDQGYMVQYPNESMKTQSEGALGGGGAVQRD